MKFSTIVHEVNRLPLSERISLIEQTLKTIKHENIQPIGNLKKSATKKTARSEAVDKDYLINLPSLAEAWLSKEDDRWDQYL
jgi:hypothetical protein